MWCRWRGSGGAWDQTNHCGRGWGVRARSRDKNKNPKAPRWGRAGKPVQGSGLQKQSPALKPCGPIAGGAWEACFQGSHGVVWGNHWGHRKSTSFVIRHGFDLGSTPLILNLSEPPPHL